MTVFSVFTLVGGLAFFLYGMDQMSQSLKKMAGDKMEAIINKMTSNRVVGLLLGLGVTVAIQSSSAVTVMLVGLVNSGLMKLSNTVGVIMGSNIGTTITAWIMSLIGVSGDSFFIKMLKPESFSPLLAFVGIVLVMVSKKERRRELGNCLLGFAILMYGMVLMSDSVAPLADSPQFASILTAFENPLLGVLTGLVVTAVIQSSSASVGTLQALSMTGSISYSVAIPIIMGQNIGTCATAILSSIGVSKNAKRVTAIHLAFNLIGTAVFMVLFYVGHALFRFSFIDAPADPAGIALCHSAFNIGTTVLLLPFAGSLVKIAERAVKIEEQPEIAFLDERLFNTPSVALAECDKLSAEMAAKAEESVAKAFYGYFAFEASLEEQVSALEGEVDIYEDRLGTYLVKLSGTGLSESDQLKVAKMLHSISNFERMSDHARNLIYIAKDVAEKKDLQVSDEARLEMEAIERAVKEIVSMTVEAYQSTNTELARRVEPLEQVIDLMVDTCRSNHTNRLQAGTCTLERGLVLADTLNCYERIADHCSNIAVAVLEAGEVTFSPHEYLRQVKFGGNEEFQRLFSEYQETYCPTLA